jgi:hypothetical protein
MCLSGASRWRFFTAPAARLRAKNQFIALRRHASRFKTSGRLTAFRFGTLTAIGLAG